LTDKTELNDLRSDIGTVVSPKAFFFLYQEWFIVEECILIYLQSVTDSVSTCSVLAMRRRAVDTLSTTKHFYSVSIFSMPTLYIVFCRRTTLLLPPILFAY